MSRGINKVILIGHVGKDIEFKTMNFGHVANCSLATSESYKDKQGQQINATEWHRLVFFNKLAEITSKYLKKGSKVYIEGSLKTRKYTDKNNIERSSTEIIVHEMQMLDSKKTNEQKNNIEEMKFDDEIPF